MKGAEALQFDICQDVSSIHGTSLHIFLLLLSVS